MTSTAKSRSDQSSSPSQKSRSDNSQATGPSLGPSSNTPDDEPADTIPQWRMAVSDETWKSMCIELIDHDPDSQDASIPLTSTHNLETSASAGSSPSWWSSIQETFTDYCQRAHLGYLDKYISTQQQNKTGISRYISMAGMYARDLASATLDTLTDTAWWYQGTMDTAIPDALGYTKEQIAVEKQIHKAGLIKQEAQRRWEDFKNNETAYTAAKWGLGFAGVSVGLLASGMYSGCTAGTAGTATAASALTSGISAATSASASNFGSSLYSAASSICSALPALVGSAASATASYQSFNNAWSSYRSNDSIGGDIFHYPRPTTFRLPRKQIRPRSTIQALSCPSVGGGPSLCSIAEEDEEDEQEDSVSAETSVTRVGAPPSAWINPARHADETTASESNRPSPSYDMFVPAEHFR